MDLFQQTIDICDKFEIKPVRSKGQNFLIEEDVYDRIITAADLSQDDIVLEVGPGLGFLTQKLAAKARKVITVELDDKLAGLLKANLQKQGVNNVEVVNEDVLKFLIFNFKFLNNFKFQNFKFKIVANLPYNITSRFLRYVLTQEIRPQSMVLMLQKEVAQRIVAKPPKMSLLAVSVQFYAKPEIIGYVPTKAFWPEPEVNSAIVRIMTNPPSPSSVLLERTLYQGGEIIPPTPFDKGGVEKGVVDKEIDFFRMVKFGFAAKRKMLKNNLAAGYNISQENAVNYLKLANLTAKVRAENLSVEDWVRLFEVLGKNML